jgi:hypothetical protein
MLLATKADGKRMPVDRSGSIRIVFPRQLQSRPQPRPVDLERRLDEGRLGP